jgi:hypothetical protein
MKTDKTKHKTDRKQKQTSSTAKLAATILAEPEQSRPSRRALAESPGPTEELADRVYSCYEAGPFGYGLPRLVGGNAKAFSVVRVPTEAQEQARSRSRQREALQNEKQRLAAQGRSHGLYYGGKYSVSVFANG